MIKREIRDLLKVYFIMGSNNSPGNPLETVEDALKGGVTLFQFREKGKGALKGEEKAELASNIRSLCKEYGVPFLVNDDIELALALEADGVHIGQEDEPASIVRGKIDGKILGVSVHTLEEAKKAVAEGADYLGIGPIYQTSTKEDAKGESGTILIEQIRAAGMDIPIVGIGGITAANAGAVVKAGADGVSVITAISMAASPLQAAKDLGTAVGLE
ncbi:thiamine phosphate synthase [Neobacillus terrae]|uniref:thiamine phosphate synthase n=1 Tax=Neobacillus terrae TaxID=3034837 RepID=UPI00140CF79D|nr:thiamine phosphate synthase [Neobacillus terrae]NHM32590.1 thiamine phosphate synthase [Neobacillus terrae]